MAHERVSAALAKARFSALVADVAYRGKHFVIERRGKPLAALVSVDELERLEQRQATSAQPHGALALVGAWHEVEDDDLDTLVASIYARREEDTDRSVDLEE